MAICDVCNEESSLEAGTCYTAEEFQELASRGFKPEGGAGRAVVLALAKMSGRSEDEAWKLTVDEGSASGWFLCPTCAARASRIIPKPAGTYTEFLDQLAPRSFEEHLRGSRNRAPRQYLSKLAIWARLIAGFAFVATVFAVILTRSGMLEMKSALAIFAGALGIAVVALLLGLAALAVIWMKRPAGVGAALTATAIAFLLLVYPAFLAIQAYRLPWISDITTDPISPPGYEALARLRPRDANPVAYAGLYAAEQQRAAYPDIGPLGTNANAQSAYRAALAVMNKRKDSFMAPYWRVIEARDPDPGAGKGASKRSPILRSWAFATTSPSAFAKNRTARVSMRAPPRSTGRSISAPMRRASAGC
jgi:hypothetical protein